MQALVAAKSLSLDELDLLNELLDARDEARARAKESSGG